MAGKSRRGAGKLTALTLGMIAVCTVTDLDHTHRAAAATTAPPAVPGDKKDVHVVFSIDVTGQFAVWNIYGKIVPMAIADVNSRDDILPGYNIVPHFIDDGCSRGLGIDRMYEQLYRDPPKIALAGIICSSVCMALAETSQRWNISMVSSTCVDPGLSNKALYRRFFRTCSSEKSIVSTRLELLRHFQWDTISLLHEPTPPFSTVTELTTRAISSQNLSVTVLTTESVGDNPTLQIKSMMERDTRIVMGGMMPINMPRLFCEAFKLGFYGPHITWVLPGFYVANLWELYTDTHDCTVEQVLLVAQDTIMADNSWKNLEDTPSLTGHTQSEIDALVDQWQSEAEVVAKVPFCTASYYDSALAVAMALNLTETRLREKGMNRTIADFTYSDIEMADMITQAFYDLEFQGIKGNIKFDDEGDFNADAVIYQQKGREKKYVGWHKKNTGKFEWTNGGITWQRGAPPIDKTTVILRARYVSDALYFSVVGVAGFGILLNLGFVIFNFKHRHMRLIKMSSPNINTLILIGCMIAFASVMFELRAENASIAPYICSLRSSLFIVGFSLSFGGLFSKTWRVHVILTKSMKTAKKTTISDVQLFAIVGIIVLVDLIVIVTWQLYDPYTVVMRNQTAEVHQEDRFTEILVMTQLAECTTEYKTYFQGALFVIQGAMLAFGVFLAWETRKVKLAALNDSKLIGMCIYNVVILSIIGAAISMVITGDPETEYGFASAFLVAATFLVSGVLFIPKIVSVYRVTVEPATGSGSGTGTGAGTDLSTNPAASRVE